MTNSISFRHVLLLALALIVFQSSALAQDEVPDQKELRKLVVGTWSIDLDKCKELLEEDEIARLPSSTDGIELQFQDDGSLKMLRQGSSRDANYELLPLKESETEYKCSIEFGGREMTATITIIEENVIKMTPEGGEPPAILTRPMKELTLDEAKALVVGKWKNEVTDPGDLLPDDTSIKLEYLEDGKMLGVDVGEGPRPTGTWTMSSLDDESRTNQFAMQTIMKFTQDGQELSTTDDVVIQIVDSNKIRVSETNGNSIVFVREKE